MNAVAHLYSLPLDGETVATTMSVTSSEVAAANFRTREIVTAIRSASGRLRLLSWSVDGVGRITKLGDSNEPVEQAGLASNIDIARVDDRFVVACRTDEGRLRLISWEVIFQTGMFGPSGEEATAAI